MTFRVAAGANLSPLLLIHGESSQKLCHYVHIAESTDLNHCDHITKIIAHFGKVTLEIRMTGSQWKPFLFSNLFIPELKMTPPVNTSSTAIQNSLRLLKKKAI